MKTVGFAIVFFWIAAVLQYALADRIQIFGARPDFLLITALCFSQVLGRRGGAICGFAAGMLMGAMVGANLTHYAISRTVAGFLSGWIKPEDQNLEYLPFLITTIGLSLVAGFIFMLGAGPKNLISYLLDTIGSAVYNGVLAIPLYAIVRRIGGSKTRGRLMM